MHGMDDSRAAELVAVDTSVWSLMVRRPLDRLDPLERKARYHLEDLANAGRALLLGPVRQELLTGLRGESRFEQARGAVAGVPDEPLDEEDFVEAARCANRCRAAGIAGSPVDFLLCAAAIRRGVPVFTADRDFDRYAQVLPVRIHEPS